VFEDKQNLNWRDRRRVIRLGFWAGIGFWLATLVVSILAAVVLPFVPFAGGLFGL
jgi:hypothetical protein